MKYLLLSLFAITFLEIQASEAQYTLQGKIEFERKSNIHRQMEDMSDGDDNDWFSRVKSQIPRFNSAYFDYTFTRTQSLYKPGRETENAFRGFGSAPATDNVVAMDFNAGRVVAAKNIFEEKFLVQDSLPRFTWKIHDEIRTIANYSCRKAVTVICDSVYVVAFYTDDIPASGGPEMFNGLPGMILQISIPRLYTTWMATKVELLAPDANALKAPEKGKKVTQKQLYDQLMSSISKWGKWAHRSIWWSTL